MWRSSQHPGERDPALRAADERLETVLHAVPVAVMILDARGVVRFWNPGAERIFGWRDEEILGRVLPTVPADRADEFRRNIDETLAGRALSRVEARRRRKDGALIDVMLSTAALRDASGQPRYVVAAMDDVTDRKRAEEALRISEERLRVAVETAALETWEWPLGGGDREVFAAATRDVVPEDVDRVVAAMREAIAHRREYQVQYRRRGRDGEVHWLDARGRALYDARGRGTRVVGVSTDITGRKRREERVRFLSEATHVLGGSLDYETTLRTLARLAVPAIADFCAVDVVTDDGTIQRLAAAHADARKERLAADLVQRYPLRVNARHGVPAVVRTREPVFHPEPPEWLTASALRDERDREILRALAVRSVIIVPLVARGRTLGTISLLTADSGRRYGEDDLALAEELAYRAAVAVDNARLYGDAQRQRREAEIIATVARTINASLDLDAVVGQVAEGARELCDADVARVVVRDPASDAMRLRRWVGAHWSGYHDGMTVEPGRGSGGHVLVTGRPFRTENYAADPRITGDDLAGVREEGVVAQMVVPIQTEGRVEGLLYVDRRAPRPFSDREEAVLVRLADQAAVALRNLELLRREQASRADAEHANRAKDEFLATLSHELRTPLTSIVGWLQLLRAGTLAGDQRAHALDVIARNARVQAQLIEDLLDVSRIVTGKLRLDVRRVALTAVVSAAVESVAATAAAKGLALGLSMPETAVDVDGDPDRLQQVVSNLLTNALKFTGAGGRVDVRVEHDPKSVRVVVSDAGQGIAPDALPFIFERFHQGGGTAARPQSGLGLGLAIVRHLVEMHHGTVRAESDGEGRGATFTVELPLAGDRGDDDLAGARGSEAALPSLAGVRVLVVDDDADTRELLRFALVSYQAHVALAGSVAEARQALQDTAVDVVISDLSMPVEDGYALIHDVRRRDEAQGRHLPAIALTAHARSQDRGRALAAGFDAYVAKPVDPVELVHLIARRAGSPAADRAAD